jgi:hypothetical protein
MLGIPTRKVRLLESLILAELIPERRYTSEEQQIQGAKALIEELKNKSAPNEQSREWGQIGTCHRLITSSEVIVKLSELAKRWMGEPVTPFERMAEELTRLNEGWTRKKAEEVMRFKREVIR